VNEPMDPNAFPDGDLPRGGDPDATMVNPAASVAWRDPAAAPPGRPTTGTGSSPAGPAGPSDGEERKWKTAFLVLAAAIVVIILVIVGIVLFRSGESDDGSTTTTSSTTTAATTTGPTTAAATTTTATTTSAATTTTAASAPTISAFTAAPSPAPCPGTVAVELTWSTANSTGVTIAIDGPGVYGSYPASGNASVPFNCDGDAHTYTLTANGEGPSQARTITVNPAN